MSHLILPALSRRMYLALLRRPPSTRYDLVANLANWSTGRPNWSIRWLNHQFHGLINSSSCCSTLQLVVYWSIQWFTHQSSVLNCNILGPYKEACFRYPDLLVLPQTFLASEALKYWTCVAILLSAFAINVVISVSLWTMCRSANA
jgi:hypothetical protein